MPTYEYQCQNCGYKVEYFQAMHEAPRSECPRCHGHLSRLVTSGAGLIFKGSGFYITDYKNKHVPDGGNGKSHSQPVKAAEPSTEKNIVTAKDETH